MPKMDKYVVELARIASELENLCDISKCGGQDISSVLEHCSEKFEALPKGALRDLNVEISRRVLQLSYTKDRLAYYGKRKLDYSNYPLMKDVAKALLAFTEKKKLEQDRLSELNKVIIILSSIEEKDSAVMNTLGYQYLRIFLVLIVYGSYCNASILARFVIEQMIIKE